MDVVRQGFGTGCLDGLQPVGEHGAEDLDHLPVTAGLAFQLALHAPDRNRQVPLFEWRAIAQGPGFAGQNGYVVQGIVDGIVAPEDTFMTADDPAVLPAFEPICVSSDLDRPPHGTGIDRVSVLVEPHEAGLGYRRRHGVETVEGNDVRNKARALFFQHLPDRLVPHLRVRVRPGVGQTAIFEPGVQFGIGFELRSRHEEPSPQDPDLVLDLTLHLAIGPPNRRICVGSHQRLISLSDSRLLPREAEGACLTEAEGSPSWQTCVAALVHARSSAPIMQGSSETSRPVCSSRSPRRPRGHGPGRRDLARCRVVEGPETWSPTFLPW